MNCCPRSTTVPARREGAPGAHRHRLTGSRPGRPPPDTPFERQPRQGCGSDDNRASYRESPLLRRREARGLGGRGWPDFWVDEWRRTGAVGADWGSHNRPSNGGRRARQKRVALSTAGAPHKTSGRRSSLNWDGLGTQNQPQGRGGVLFVGGSDEGNQRVLLRHKTHATGRRAMGWRVGHQSLCGAVVRRASGLGARGRWGPVHACQRCGRALRTRPVPGGGESVPAPTGGGWGMSAMQNGEIGAKRGA
jgi:hypothetical protein